MRHGSAGYTTPKRLAHQRVTVTIDPNEGEANVSWGRTAKTSSTTGPERGYRCAQAALGASSTLSAHQTTVSQR